MRIMECIGSVTLSRWHPSLSSAIWKVAVPLKAEAIGGNSEGRMEPLVIYDEFAAGIGSIMAVSESAEAAAPFHPDVKPIDAYNAAILDDITLG